MRGPAGARRPGRWVPCCRRISAPRLVRVPGCNPVDRRSGLSVVSAGFLLAACGASASRAASGAPTNQTRAAATPVPQITVSTPTLRWTITSVAKVETLQDKGTRLRSTDSWTWLVLQTNVRNVSDKTQRTNGGGLTLRFTVTGESGELRYRPDN